MYDDILVPTDGSDGVQAAIEHAIELASMADATVHGLYVVDTADATAVPEGKWVTIAETLEEAGEQAVEEIEQQASEAGVTATGAVVKGKPHEEITSYATENEIDLIVMGTHGRSGLDRVLLGSVTDKVIRQADVPVLIKRYNDDESAE